MWEIFHRNIEWCNLAKIQLSVKSKSNLPLLKLFPFTLTFKFTLLPGHFIVVCGYNKVKKLIYYMNPNDSHGKFSAITIVLLNFLEEMQLGQVLFKVFFSSFSSRRNMQLQHGTIWHCKKTIWNWWRFVIYLQRLIFTYVLVSIFYIKHYDIK